VYLEVNCDFIGFQDEEDNIGTEFAFVEGVHLPSIPQREIVNKENLIHPGPWTSKPRKMHMAAIPVSRLQQPSFECENMIFFWESFCRN
jgi:hypothetical protein